MEIIFFLSALFVAFVEGFFNPFTFLNCAPILAAYLALKVASRGKSYKEIIPVIAFSFSTVAFIVFWHLAWVFDWGETSSGSSTAALMFIFIPIYSIVFGLIGFLFGLLFNKIWNWND